MKLKNMHTQIEHRREELLSRVGGTSLVPLRCLGNRASRVFGKAEWENPGGSVKDRAVRAMILEAEANGSLTPERTLLDATSGNTGIAVALFGRALGYDVEIVMPANAGEGRKRLIRALGARLVLTDPLEGSDGAILEARRRYDRHERRYVYLDQYRNEANWRAHYETTAVEIWEQTRGRVTTFVAGLGTSGTFMGVGRRLKEIDPAIEIVSFQPQEALHGLEGLKHMESAIVPSFYVPELADRDLRIATEDAYRMVRRLAKEEGLLVGPSAGAAAWAAERLAAEEDGRTVVTVLCDNADRYLGEEFWRKSR